MMNGLRIIESVYLTEAGPPVEVRRPWRERLFTRPWRPFKKTQTVVPQVPYNGVIQLNKDTLIIHPETLRKIMTERLL